jgi:hypothetical protein
VPSIADHVSHDVVGGISLERLTALDALTRDCGRSASSAGTTRSGDVPAATHGGSPTPSAPARRLALDGTATRLHA